MSTALEDRPRRSTSSRLRPDARREGRGDAQEQGQRDLVRRGGREDRRRRHALALRARQPDANLNFGYRPRRRSAPSSSCRSGTRTRSSSPTPRSMASTRRAPRTRCRWRAAVLDRWILSPLHQLVAEVARRARRLRPDRGARAIERFVVDELSNWYIRRNRPALLEERERPDKAAAYQTLYEVLTTLRAAAGAVHAVPGRGDVPEPGRAVDPRAPESVHLTDFPGEPPAIDRPTSRATWRPCWRSWARAGRRARRRQSRFASRSGGAGLRRTRRCFEAVLRCRTSCSTS